MSDEKKPPEQESGLDEVRTVLSAGSILQKGLARALREFESEWFRERLKEKAAEKLADSQRQRHIPEVEKP